MTDKQRAREYKQALRFLSERVLRFEKNFDEAMKLPASEGRDKVVAEIMNYLTMNNQSAMRCLGYSWPKIRKLYAND